MNNRPESGDPAEIRELLAEIGDRQREAVDRARLATRVALPGIAFCIVPVVNLVVRYF